MKRITTVCGDIAPEKLGYTSIHEHTLLTMEKAFANMPKPTAKLSLQNLSQMKESSNWMGLEFTLRYDDMDAEIAELKKFKEIGGDSIMDCSYNGCRIEIDKTRMLSEKSGVNIVVCSGYYTPVNWPDDLDPYNKEAIRETELREIQEGLDGTDIKAGCLKAAFGGGDIFTDALEENELALFRATCSVAADTGYPIAIHPPLVRENVLKIVDVAVECGVAPDKINLCHQDCLITYRKEFPDYREFMRDPNRVTDSFVEYAKKLLDKGVYINFDSWGCFHTCEPYDGGMPWMWSLDDNRRMAALLPLMEAGYAGQIMFGHDKSCAMFNYYNGSYGYTRFTNFAVPALKAMGFEKEAHQITVENPAKFLAHD